MSPPVLALDVGGTKLTAGLVTADGEVSIVRRAATPVGSPRLVFDVLVDLAEAVFHEAGSPALQGVGVAFDPSGWDAFSLGAGLERRHPGLTPPCAARWLSTGAVPAADRPACSA